jgi:hypothetical protein
LRPPMRSPPRYSSCKALERQLGRDELASRKGNDQRDGQCPNGGRPVVVRHTIDVVPLTILARLSRTGSPRT